MSLFFSFVAATSFSPLVVASSFSFFMNRPLIASPSRSTHVPTPVSSVLIGLPSFDPFVDQK